MSSKKIYLVRHGQTEYNEKGIIQGSGVNAPLNERGRQQALAFYKQYKDIPFDKIYTSQLSRTIESVQPFIDAGIPWEPHSGLNEISWGNTDGIQLHAEENYYYREVMEAWKAGDVEMAVEGGESPRDVSLRQKQAMDLILSRPEEKTVLICMHGRAMRILLSYLIHMDLRTMNTFEHSNMGLYILYYDYNTQQFSVEKSNCIKHLPE